MKQSERETRTPTRDPPAAHDCQLHRWRWWVSRGKTALSCLSLLCAEPRRGTSCPVPHPDKARVEERHSGQPPHLIPDLRRRSVGHLINPLSAAEGPLQTCPACRSPAVQLRQGRSSARARLEQDGSFAGSGERLPAALGCSLELAKELPAGQGLACPEVGDSGFHRRWDRTRSSSNHPRRRQDVGADRASMAGRPPPAGRLAGGADKGLRRSSLWVYCCIVLLL